MAHQSFAQRVIDALKELSVESGEVEAGAVSSHLFMQTGRGHKRVLNTLSELSRSGRITRIRQGVYSPALKTGNPDKREVMWRVMKMRRVVTNADLQELAGVSESYAKEWLQLLVRRGVAVRITPPNKNTPHSWRLIKTDCEMPVDSEKAARLRRRRSFGQKLIEKRLAKIEDNVQDIRKVLQTMEE